MFPEYVGSVGELSQINAGERGVVGRLMQNVSTSCNQCICFDCVAATASTLKQYTSRPNDFPFTNWPISVSHFNKFRFDSQFFRFRCLLAIFHTKLMIVLYDMGLFLNSTICGVTFDSRD